MNAIIPIPQTPIAIRPATLADIPFMDSLQKKYNKALGYFPTRQFEGYVQTGGVLIAESEAGDGEAVKREDRVTASPLHRVTPLGYCISRDRYLKRDELGVVFQLCVAPGTQRKLVGAALVREVFERSAYGCRLYCCWCAQDLDANYFWESLGFVPIAFRAGSDSKRRVHIFWQKRIGKGDAVTPYWYPFQTSSGAIRQDRLVFPIPPGVHWKDVQAVSLPGAELRKLAAAPTRVKRPRAERGLGSPPALREPLPERSSGAIQDKRAAGRRKRSGGTPKPHQVAILVGGRMKYVSRPGYVAPDVANESSRLPALLPALPLTSLPALAPPKPARKPKAPPEKIDPKFLAAARELRDRYLENLNGEQCRDPGNAGRALPGGKYDVSRLPAPATAPAPKRAMPMLAA